MELWAEYKRSGNPRVRDPLVLTFAPMVKYIVYRKAREIPARCEVDDFISCGLEALIRTIDRFDPAKGATLELSGHHCGGAAPGRRPCAGQSAMRKAATSRLSSSALPDRACADAAIS